MAAFSNRPGQRKNALGRKLEAVVGMIDRGEYQNAIDKLLDDIRIKADGSLGSDPTDDWITDPDVQQEVCSMIDELVSYIRTLM